VEIFLFLALIVLSAVVLNTFSAPKTKKLCKLHAWTPHEQGFLYCKNCKRLPGLDQELDQSSKDSE